MCSEDERVCSFYGWGVPNIDPKRLAHFGFFYLNPKMEIFGYSRLNPGTVMCFSCGAVVTDWEVNDNIGRVHIEFSPCCTFMRNSESPNARLNQDLRELIDVNN